LATEGRKLIFCIDTSSIIEARSVRYPVPVFPSLWEKIEKAISQANIISPEIVRDELKRNDPACYTWAKNQSGLFIPPDDALIKGVQAVLKSHRKLVDENLSYDQADPYVISLAQLRECTVVTEEKPGPSKRKDKIPDVCKSLGVRVTTFIGMVEEFGWRF